ncbi:hypothetical protein ACFVUN_35930 [Kitasatospora griseola]|uniref:hypothetical protein n=1 Tax=Kitasatospora griseola TaxID=2064 RepID=UPI0036D80D70
MSNTSSNGWPADSPADGLPRRPTPAAVEVLVEEAVEAIVGAPSADTVLGLVDGLDRSGALWTGALALLGPLASRPLAGLGEQESVSRLRKLAETADLVSRLTHGLSSEFRARGAAAARTIWDAAPAEIRRGAAAQMVVVYCRSIGGEAGVLSPTATVRLLREVVPVTW